MKHLTWVLLFCLLCAPMLRANENKLIVTSPDDKLSVELMLTPGGDLYYLASYYGSPLLEGSRLGLIREDADFSTALKLKKSSKVTTVKDNYSHLYGKKAQSHYVANHREFNFVNQEGKPINVIVQVSDDGFGFRYSFPDTDQEIKKVSKELTSFNFMKGTTAWIQPRAKSKTGWNQVNPSYEEHYLTDIPLTKLVPNDSGWVFPALFKINDVWINLTESWPDNYCGSHLNKGRKDNELIIDFPEPTEGFPGKAVYPESSLPWSTPWRIVTIGSLKTLAESTLGTDLAEPSCLENTGYVKPGRAAWSWALMKDPSVNYDTQVDFINYAARMGWEYCLVDVNWDTQIGWDGIQKLVSLADSKGVGLILWYNSAGSWNTTPYHPKDMLADPQIRKKEFAKLHEMGIKGVKVDFFGGDGQSMMDYYREILQDANASQLVVNCHGATLPRGLERTYPNLVSMEAIRGFEYATFSQETADRVPIKSTVVPFTRNIFDPMDFTPVCFTEYDNNHRVTGNAAELAQAVLFLSGVQHYAETPAGMETVPEYVQKFMMEIPVSWDETRYIDGYPDSYIIIARRTGNTWFVAGINAGDVSRDIEFELPFNFSGRGVLITEGDSLRSFEKKELTIEEGQKIKLQLKENGGFVMRCKVME